MTFVCCYFLFVCWFFFPFCFFVFVQKYFTTESNRCLHIHFTSRSIHIQLAPSLPSKINVVTKRPFTPSLRWVIYLCFKASFYITICVHLAMKSLLLPFSPTGRDPFPIYQRVKLSCSLPRISVPMHHHNHNQFTPSQSRTGIIYQ